MNLLKGYIVPHPPILVMGSEDDKKKLNATLEAYSKIAEELKISEAELVVLITPHGPLFVDGLCVYEQDQIDGNFSNFGHREITGIWDNDINFINSLVSKATDSNITFVKLAHELVSEFNLSSKLDHGAMVPLKLLDEGLKNKKVVVINYGLLPVDALYKFGQLLTETFEEQNKKTVVIASGDLSHCLLETGPYGYREEGVEFDREYVKAFEKGSWKDLLFVEEHLLERAGECGKRSIEILLGAFDQYSYETEKLSYEGPFGVGYLTGVLKPITKNKESRFDTVLEIQQQRIKEKVNKESSVVQLARKGIRIFLESGETYHPDTLLDIEEAGQRLGVFVSLKDTGGLRGCIGSTGGIAPTIEEEIVEMGIKAATRDPRFDPVSIEELERLTISVDILSHSEPVENIQELNPKKYGIIVKSNHKHGLLLPDLEGIETIEEQICIALNKAGIIPEDETYDLYKFTVKRFY